MESKTINSIDPDEQLAPDALQINVKAPIQLLQIILQALVMAEAQTSEITRLLNAPLVTLASELQPHLNFSIPIQRLRNLPQIVYETALPQLLAKGNSPLALQISSHLVAQIRTRQANFFLDSQDLGLPKVLIQGLLATATPTGKIQFQLFDQAIAHWLNVLLSRELPLTALSSLSKSPRHNSLTQPHHFFAAQHAHARCCSILRHADRQHLITLACQEEGQRWSFTCPAQIPWLTSTQQIQPLHLAEFQLIAQLIAVLDLLVSQPPDLVKHLVLHVEALSTKFHQVHRACQVFGDEFKVGGDRVQAHLALVLATQRVLFQLLTALNVAAPTEL